MSKYFDKFEKHVNNVTAKFLNEQTTDMYNVRTNLKFAVKTARNKSKKFSFNELKSIWFAINTLGTAAAGELVGVQNLPVLADWVKVSQAALIDDARGTPSKEDMEKVGVDNRTDYLKKVYGGDPQFAYKEINLYTKTILANLAQETQGRNLGTIDKTKDVGIGFTLQQLENALATADTADISIVDALSQETGRKLSKADVDAAFDKVDELGKKVDTELSALTAQAEDMIKKLKKTHENHPDYDNTFSKNILSSLSLTDIFKTDSLTIAYVELREWATRGNPSWQQKLVNLIPTIDAIAPIVTGLEGKQAQFELSQKQQAMLDAARQETDIRNQVRQTAKDKVARDDAASQETDIRNAIRQAAQDAVDRSNAGEEELANRNFIRAEAKRIAKEKNLAASQETAIRNAIRDEAKNAGASTVAARQETAIRDAIRQVARDAVDRKRSGEEELANRNFIRAEAKRIAKEKNLAASQETAIRNAIRDAAKNVGASAIAARDQDLYGADDDKPYDQRYDADTDQDFAGADDDKPYDQRYDADKDQDFVGADDDAPYDQRYDADTDQDFLGDPETGPEGGTGAGRSDDSSGYLEMARREFDKALANTKGPTRGNGASETARRAFDTAIKNMTGPTRGNYGARLEMSKRAFVQALKNTLDTGRGDGFKETARRAFDTAIKNTLNTGRGSGESQVERRYIDNARSDINKWMQTNRAPNDEIGGFVAVDFTGSEVSADDQIEAQRELSTAITNMFDDEQGEARANYIISQARVIAIDDIDSDKATKAISNLFDPTNRERYITNLKQTYVKYKAQEDFLKSQVDNPTLYYGFNPSNLNSIKGISGTSNFKLSNTIFYSLELLTQVVPDAIQKHSTEQSVIDANEPVDLDKDQLDQQAANRTAKLEKAVQERDDQSAARAAAGEEELANRDEIRADARETAEREQERRRIIADQLTAFKEIEANTTSNEAAFDAVIEMLDKQISTVEADVAGTAISSLENLQAVLDDQYSQQAKIISNSINGKEQFEELDERLYKVIAEKQKQFIQTLDEVYNTLKDQVSGEDSNINVDYVFSVDTAKLRTEINSFSTVDNIPENFITSSTARVEQIDKFVDKLQSRYDFYNDEFMVLRREVHDLMKSVINNIDDIDYDGLVDLSEDTEELFELSQTGDRSESEQDLVDMQYANTEQNLKLLVDKKALNFAKRVQGVRNDVVTKTKIDTVDIIEGDLVLTPEAFDELYKNKDTVDDLIEEFEVIQDFFETLETEGPEYFVTIQDFLDTLVQFYQITEDYKKTMTGPGGRQSPDDAYRFYSQTLNKVRNPDRAGSAGREAPSPEARAELKGKGAVRFWQGRRDDEGLPLTDKEGNQLGSFSDKKAQFRTDISAMSKDKDGNVVENGIENGLRKLLAWRRVWQLYTNNFVDNPSRDKFLRYAQEQMKRNNRNNKSNFKNTEIQALLNNTKAVKYLDKLKDQYHG